MVTELLQSSGGPLLSLEGTHFIGRYLGKFSTDEVEVLRGLEVVARLLILFADKHNKGLSLFQTNCHYHFLTWPCRFCA